MTRFLLLSLAAVLIGCMTPSVEVVPILVECDHALIFRPRSSYSRVLVVQLMDSGELVKTAMTKDENGDWFAKLSGTADQRYVLSVDEHIMLDPTAALSVIKNGQEWSYRPKNLCDKPSFAFVQREQIGPRKFITLQFKRASPGHGLMPDSVVASVGSQDLSVDTIGDQVLVDITTLEAGKHWLRLEAEDTDGVSSELFHAPFWVEERTFSWQHAQLYQVITDRFAGFEQTPTTAWNIGRYRGGTWRGVTEKLQAGYFDELGINALWISPINRNADGLWVGVEGGSDRYESYHGYWKTSDTELNHNFGDEHDLRALTAEAHRRGIRVILDVVMNHRHQDYQDDSLSTVRTNSKCVCGQDICPWWSDIQRCWFTPYLPDIDYQFESTLNAEVEAVIDLVQRFDFDGVRVDAVPMMPRFVVRRLKHRMRQVHDQLDAHSLLLGETFTDENGHENIRYYLGVHGLDGQFDFPLMWKLRDVFHDPLLHSQTIVDAWRSSQSAWAGSESTMALMVGNHDVARFMSHILAHEVYSPWTAPPPSSRVYEQLRWMLSAQSLLLALPGIWTLYYGDEVGLSGGTDPDNRRPLPFDSELSESQLKLRNALRSIATNRQCLGPNLSNFAELQSVNRRTLTVTRFKTNGAPSLFVYVPLPNGDMDQRNENVDISLPADVEWIDILTGTTFSGVLEVNSHHTDVKWLVPLNNDCRISGGQ